MYAGQCLTHTSRPCLPLQPLQPSASSKGQTTSCKGSVATAQQQLDADMAEVLTPVEGSQGRA
eukprot:scaffold71813_cov21-Tisochrysis_lutea.AAC.1